MDGEFLILGLAGVSIRCARFQKIMLFNMMDITNLADSL
jgi:hypothetical protein